MTITIDGDLFIHGYIWRHFTGRGGAVHIRVTGNLLQCFYKELFPAYDPEKTVMVSGVLTNTLVASNYN